MRVMAQVGMVMNLDKCIGCHTCSVTCKQAWTNRAGMEYAWFNNVETRPGQGYPRTYQDQEKWKGGWVLRRGKLRLRAGGRLQRLGQVFSNPNLPTLNDYYEPWTYEYDTLISAPLGEHTPVARPKSLITGDPMKISWSANWDDDLGGGPELAIKDPVLLKIKDEVGDRVKMEFEQAFMFYLPRICEHCLNPACVASCPSGAMYKRAEDGIVLVDQDALQGLARVRLRLPVQEGLLQPPDRQGREVHALLPADRGGPSHRVLRDLRRAAAVSGPVPLRRGQGHGGRGNARRAGPLRGAARSHPRPQRPRSHRGGQAGRHRGRLDRCGAALSRLRPREDLSGGAPAPPRVPHHADGLVHPAARPVVDALRDTGHDAEETGNIFGALDAMRIPIEYLAELFTAGDAAPVRAALETLAAMRGYMRGVNLGGERDEAIARVRRPHGGRDRSPLPPARHRQVRGPVRDPQGPQRGRPRSGGACASTTDGGPGLYESGRFGEASGRPIPVAVENFHALKARQGAESFVPRRTSRRASTCLNWDGAVDLGISQGPLVEGKVGGERSVQQRGPRRRPLVVPGCSLYLSKRQPDAPEGHPTLVGADPQVIAAASPRVVVAPVVPRRRPSSRS